MPARGAGCGVCGRVSVAGSSSGRIDDSRGNLAQEDSCRSGPWLSQSTARRGSGRNKPDMGFASQQLAANSGNLKQARDGDTQATTSRPTGSSAGLWRRDIRRLGRPSHQIKECAQGWCSCDAGGCGSGNHPVIPVIQCAASKLSQKETVILRGAKETWRQLARRHHPGLCCCVKSRAQDALRVSLAAGMLADSGLLSIAGLQEVRLQFELGRQSWDFGGRVSQIG